MDIAELVALLLLLNKKTPYNPEIGSMWIVISPSPNRLKVVGIGMFHPSVE